MVTESTAGEVQRILSAMTQSQKIKMAQLLLQLPVVKVALDGMGSNKRTDADALAGEAIAPGPQMFNGLPDRGRDIETKTVADPHSKPVQE